MQSLLSNNNIMIYEKRYALNKIIICKRNEYVQDKIVGDIYNN